MEGFLWRIFALLAAVVLSGCSKSGPVSSGNKSTHVRTGLYAERPFDSAKKLDIIFVHGVDGHYRQTWEPAEAPDKNFVTWIAADMPAANVWSAQYDVSTKSFAGETMGLSARAKNMLALLDAEGLGDSDRSIVFVCHSFGGLVVKQMLRAARESPDEKWRKIEQNTKGVVLIATPNAGANFATFLNYFASSLFSKTVDDLSTENEQLTDLNQWYLRNTERIKTIAFGEGQKTGPVLVVPRQSADPGIPSSELVLIDSDHIQICKPLSKDELIYKRVLRFLRAFLGNDSGAAVNELKANWEAIVTDRGADPTTVSIKGQNVPFGLLSSCIGRLGYPCVLTIAGGKILGPLDTSSCPNVRSLVIEGCECPSTSVNLDALPNVEVLGLIRASVQDVSGQGALKEIRVVECESLTRLGLEDLDELCVLKVQDCAALEQIVFPKAAKVHLVQVKGLSPKAELKNVEGQSALEFLEIANSRMSVFKCAFPRLRLLSLEGIHEWDCKLTMGASEATIHAVGCDSQIEKIRKFASEQKAKIVESPYSEPFGEFIDGCRGN